MTIKQDELNFGDFLLTNNSLLDRTKEMDQNPRLYYVLDKWSDKGYWEYGVSLRSGWLTEDGRKEMERRRDGGN